MGAPSAGFALLCLQSSDTIEDLLKVRREEILVLLVLLLLLLLLLMALVALMALAIALVAVALHIVIEEVNGNGGELVGYVNRVCNPGFQIPSAVEKFK